MRMILCALICALPLFCLAGEPAADFQNDAKLLEALRADDFDARERARKKLLERGEDVRALLETELKRTDLDADYRDIVKTLAAHLKSSDVLKEFDTPVRIDLEVKDELISKVLERIKEKFGYEVGVRDVADKKKVSLSLKGATFMETVDALRAAGNLNYDRTDFMRNFRMNLRNGNAQAEAAKILTLRENTDEALIPASAKGPAIILIESITQSASRSINFINGGKKGGASNRHLSIQGWVLVEPKLRYSGIGMENLKGIVDKQEKLNSNQVMLNNYYSGEAKTDGLMAYNFSTSMVMTEDVTADIELKGTLKLTVPMKMTESRLDNLDQKVGKPQDLAGGTLTIDKLEQNGAEWKFDYSVSNNLREAAFRMMGWHSGENMASGSSAYSSGLFIQDAGGNSVGNHAYSSNGDGTTYHIQLQLQAKPALILFRKPAEAAARTFDFVIPKVPLP